jgi:hypothetical protein
MIVKWMDTLLAPKPLRTYVYTGRHRAARASRPAPYPAISLNLLVR